MGRCLRAFGGGGGGRGRGGGGRSVLHEEGGRGPVKRVGVGVWWRVFILVKGTEGRGATYREKRKGVHSLARDDAYELHFAEEGDFRGREAWRERKSHYKYILIEP